MSSTPAHIIVYRTKYCPYCVAAKNLLTKLNLPFEEISVDNDYAKRDWLVDATGQQTVPQIFINGKSIGGFDDLSDMVRRGTLDAFIAESTPK